MKKLAIILLTVFILTGCKNTGVNLASGEQTYNDYITDESLLDGGNSNKASMNEIEKSSSAILDSELKDSLKKKDITNLLPQNGFSDAVILENGYLMNYYSDDGLTVQIRKSSKEYSEEEFWETFNLFKDIDAFEYVTIENLGDGAYSNQKGYLYLYCNNYMYNINVLLSERYDANEKTVELAKILLEKICN